MLIDVQSVFQPSKRFFYTKHTLNADGFDSLRKLMPETLREPAVEIATLTRRQQRGKGMGMA